MVMEKWSTSERDDDALERAERFAQACNALYMNFFEQILARERGSDEPYKPLDLSEYFMVGNNDIIDTKE